MARCQGLRTKIKPDGAVAAGTAKPSCNSYAATQKIASKDFSGTAEPVHGNRKRFKKCYLPEYSLAIRSLAQLFQTVLDAGAEPGEPLL
jgi:hypothetical protein